ncbi:hypothetical protein [Georgenia deserti]|uniref:Sulfotransferase family protein n=1 Tax=Georgenia deserti TaxID=2093781 RepID=A0ABW4L1X7_9MICO
MDITSDEPQSWLDGYARGKREGARFRGELGPIGAAFTPRDNLRRLAADLTVRDALGHPVTAEDRAELRKLAAGTRQNDWDNASLGVMAMLAGRFADPAARAWLAPMLAHAGRYEEAVETRYTMAEGRPAAADFVVLVSVLAMLGRDDEARSLLAGLRSRFPNLAEEFVASWDESDIGRAYADLATRRRSAEELAVFVHLPFSGGTSMIVSLKQTVPRAAVAEVNRRYGLHQLERILAMPEEETARLRLVHLHHPFALRIRGRTLRHFTVLRDPVSQLSSGYHKRLSTQGIVPTGDTEQSTTFAEHAEYTVRHGLTNMLARQLVVTHPEMVERYARRYDRPAAFRGIGSEEEMFWFDATAELSDERLLQMCRETLEEQFSVVGSMAHLAASHLAGAATVGIPVARRIVHRGRSGQPSSALDEAQERRLREANGVDQTLYEECTARFERDFAPLIAAVEAPEKSADG